MWKSVAENFLLMFEALGSIFAGGGGALGINLETKYIPGMTKTLNSSLSTKTKPQVLK